MSMDRMAALEMQIGCTDTLNRYALAVNTRDLETFLSMFAEDGVWARPGNMTMRGREEMRAYMAPRWANGLQHRHCNGGAVIDPIDADNATVRSWTQVFDSEAPPVDGKVAMRAPAFIAEYTDHMRRDGDVWRIARRDTVVTFLAAHAMPMPGIKT